MNKVITGLIVSVLLFVGVGCGGNGEKSAKELYTSWINHYGYVVENFGVDPNEESFESYVSGLDDCEPFYGESLAYVTLLIGSTLNDHGDDVSTFIKDTNELLLAVKSEGLCGKIIPDGGGTVSGDKRIFIDPPTTTTTVPDVDVLTQELETKCWKQWNDLNGVETQWQDLGSSVSVIGGDTLVEWKRQGREIQGLYNSGADLCSGVLPSGTIDSMREISKLMGELMDLY